MLTKHCNRCGVFISINKTHKCKSTKELSDIHKKICKNPSVLKHMSDGWKEKYRNGYISPIKGRRNPKITGENNYLWKGINVKYGTLHDWIERLAGKADKCENPECHYPRINKANKLLTAAKRFHWSNKSGNYERDRKDWWMLCSSCHSLYDRKFLFKAKQKIFDKNGNRIAI